MRTRDEMNALFFRLVAYEKWGVFFISLLVVLVAIAVEFEIGIAPHGVL